MPARRRKKRNRKIRLNPSFKRLTAILLLVLGVVSVLLMLYTIRISRSVWNGEDKLSIAVDNDQDGVFVILLDPVHKEIHKFHFPENLEIEAARNLGTWKIGSLWQLGRDEMVGGKLLAHSISKSIRMPTNSWSDQGLLEVLDSGYFSIPKNLFSNQSSTNLTITDRVKISRFSSRVQVSDIFNYEVEDMGFISEARLNDGTNGYMVERNPSAKILTLFTNDHVASKSNRAVIIYSGNYTGKAKQLGEVLEVVGVKVAAIRQEVHEISDCEISTADDRVGEILSGYFDCEHNTKTATNFDVEIRIGDLFAERF